MGLAVESDSISIAHVEDELVVGICEAIEVSRAIMESRPRGGQWTEFWEYDGPSVQIQARQILSSATRAEVLPGFIREPLVEPGTEIAVLLRNSNESWEVNFIVPAEGLPDGRWLAHDGEIKPTVCG